MHLIPDQGQKAVLACRVPREVAAGIEDEFFRRFQHEPDFHDAEDLFLLAVEWQELAKCDSRLASEEFGHGDRLFDRSSIALELIKDFLLRDGIFGCLEENDRRTALDCFIGGFFQKCPINHYQDRIGGIRALRRKYGEEVLMPELDLIVEKIQTISQAVLADEEDTQKHELYMEVLGELLTDTVFRVTRAFETAYQKGRKKTEAIERLCQAHYETAWELEPEGCFVDPLKDLKISM